MKSSEKGRMVSQMSRNPFKILREHEVQKLLRSTTNLKHRTILTLIYATGIRSTELAQLKLEDIDVMQNLITVRGPKKRIILVVPKAMYLIRQYFQRYQPCKYVFENPDGEQYSNSSFQQVFNRALERSGIDKNATLNSLRISLLANLKYRGKGIRHAGDFMTYEHMVSEPDMRQQYFDRLNRSLSNL